MTLHSALAKPQVARETRPLVQKPVLVPLLLPPRLLLLLPPLKELAFD